MSIDIARNEAIQKALDFLNENPTETIAAAARIYHVHPTTLRMRRAPRRPPNQPPKPRGGNNGVLSDVQVQAIQR